MKLLGLRIWKFRFVISLLWIDSLPDRSLSKTGAAGGQSSLPFFGMGAVHWPLQAVVKQRRAGWQH